MRMNYLNLIAKSSITHSSVLCIALCHNERNILEEFLNHYRSFGDISFLIVDDRSSDGSTEFLLKQADVTLFQPAIDSTYKEHKRFWRQELLDAYGDGKWCLIPDIDEHFVYLNMENKSLSKLISEIEATGAQAMHGIMLDMYADKPFSKHIYTGGGLHSTFPFFDEPGNYWVMSTPAIFRHKFPTPGAMVFGGMRERCFYSEGKFDSFFQRLLRKVSPLPFQLPQNRLRLYKYELVRRFIYHFSGSPDMPPVNSSKLPLVKWRKGYFFNGGAHALNTGVTVFSQSAALLHYRFTRGTDGLKYTATRGQHAAGGAYCAKLVNGVVVDDRSPICAQSRKFVNSLSLKDFLE